MRLSVDDHTHQLNPLQRLATRLIAGLILLTFLGANAQALLWQSSDWLVAAVLPAVVVDLTNDERTDIAADPLTRSATLDTAAQLKAEHMAKNQYFAHFAPDGTSPWSFFDQAGYVYAHAGENLAIHFNDSAEVVSAWMDSPSHRENIENSKYTEIGVGTAKGTFEGYDTVFVVQLFGTPGRAPSAPATSADDTQKATPATPATPATSVTTPTALQDQLTALQAQLDGLQQDDGTSTNPVETVEANVEAPDVVDDPIAVISTTSSTSLATTRPAVLSNEQQSSEVVNAVQIKNSDTVVVTSELATSSGLAVATIVESDSVQKPMHAGTTVAAIMTRPNLVVDVMYSVLISVIVVLLLIALLVEARRLHYLQVAYSLLLVASAGGLWFFHTVLTSGAVVL